MSRASLIFRAQTRSIISNRINSRNSNSSNNRVSIKAASSKVNNNRVSIRVANSRAVSRRVSLKKNDHII